MPFNGAGAYSLPAGSIVADGTTIDAADFNTPLQDIEASLSQTVLRNGAAPMSGNLDVAGVVISKTSAALPEFQLNSTAGGSWKSYLSFKNSGSAKWEVGVDPSANGVNALYFYDNVANTRRFTLDENGNALIGTTSPLLWNGSNGTGVLIERDGAVSAVRTSNPAGTFRRLSTDGGVILFGRDSNNVGSISVTATATSYNSSSDYRLKENILTIPSPLSRLAELKPVNFAWKLNGARVDGFLAHEVQTVVPEAVTGQKDEVAADGTPIYQSIDQSKLIPLLTAALQEVSQSLQELRAEFNAYKASHP